MKKILTILFIGIIVLSSCGTSKEEDNKKTIITTVYPIKYITEQIAQDTLVIESIYPQNADIHEYELTTRDIQKTLEADYLFSISEQIEPFIETVQESINKGESEVEVLEIGKEQLMLDNILPSQYYDEESQKIVNYHFWTSPTRVIIITDIIYNKLIEIMPENKELYTNNYNELRKKIVQLDQEYQEVDTNQIFYVTHDAYYWLVQDYNIDIRGIQKGDHHHEVSTKEIQEIIDIIDENNIKTIYAEKDDENNKLIQTISEQTSAEVRYLNNFEVELEGEDYLDGLNSNLEEFERK